MEEIKFRITKKCLRNGKIFHRYYKLTDFYLMDAFWELDTYKVLGISQFTGLKDMNCKEIYKGDILESKYDDKEKPMVVGWSKKCASFSLNRDGWVFSHYFGEVCDSSGCKIIGNIHENPELLK
jgi:uncharacterized phage protein (TIGR01671 family)